ncbi:MbeD family mobilization/exclusion protein [Dickeya undicola]|uniref:MbeD family mobilization/exclusion protein n=1 Tax=Dickeya undicola TaxID=1577887 RepID=UPI000532CDC6|nr:MbeD family mobilization/exclusion protein [Dickeya undicola]
MTELETHLLNALKRLEQQFNAQQHACESAQNALQDMFERTLQDNVTLHRQVSSLSSQVSELTQQLGQFRSLYRQNRT